MKFIASVVTKEGTLSRTVISPLIALMEDQVAKLKANGLRAERIHSDRDPSWLVPR